MTNDEALLEANRRRMVALLMGLTHEDGMQASRLDGVRLGRATTPHPRAPVMYEPSIFIVANGRKTGFVGDRRFVYDSNNYLVLSAPLPFECITEAGEDGPMLGISIRVSPAVVSELAVAVPALRRYGADDEDACIHATPLDPAMSDATVRLLTCLQSSVDAAVLGPGIVREIAYRALCGPRGGTLLAMTQRHGQTAQIHAAMRHMHERYADPFNVSRMAGDLGMSVSAFHHHFKAVTASSPVQYLKSIRLHKARLLLAHDGVGTAEAALKVGYESPSQFSREFKRVFGASPREDSRRVRALLHPPMAPTAIDAM